LATIANLSTYARGYFKGNSDLLSTNEVAIAQEVQNYVSTYYPWKWTRVSGTNVAVSQSTQEYNLAAANQDRVYRITEAWLLSGSTDQFPLIVFDNPPVPTTDTEARPWAVSVITEDRVRLYPNPDAAYTFSFYFHDMGALFTANTESYAAPGYFDEAIKAVTLWKWAEFMDWTLGPDVDKLKQEADRRLEQQRLNELRRIHQARD